MTLENVQPQVVALLTASPSLAPFAPFLIEDGVTDHSSAIDKGLNLRGACIILGDVTGGHVDPNDPTVTSVVTFPVFVFGAPSRPHDPAGLSLLKSIIQALTARHQFRLLQFGRFMNEKGGTLTICEFCSTVVFNV